MLHVVTASDLRVVDTITVSPSGLVYVAENMRGPFLSFELSTGQNMRKIGGSKSYLRARTTLQATPDAKYDKFRLSN